MRDWESYVIKVFLVQSVCVEGRWCGPESDGACVDRVGAGTGGAWSRVPWSCRKSLFHHEKVSPQISCQPEQKVGLVLLSGKVRLGSGRWVTRLAGSGASTICSTFYGGARIWKKTPFFVLPWELSFQCHISFCFMYCFLHHSLNLTSVYVCFVFVCFWKSAVTLENSVSALPKYTSVQGVIPGEIFRLAEAPWQDQGIVEN